MRGVGIFFAAALLAVCLAAPAGAAQWYAGDGHVHTCYSDDAWCGPPPLDDDEVFDPELAFYSFGGSVAERFAEGAAKGMDFLVISDHNDIQAHTDAAFGSQGVTGIHAYEASLKKGHAQMIGAKKLYPEGDGEAPATTAMANALRVDGGNFQANHPGYRIADEPIETCAQAGGDKMNWKHGYAVLLDTIEVWNATSQLRPAELYWECWLQRGARLGALGGSDSHGANHVNIGLPMTWAYAESNSEADILKAIRAGRTTLSRVAPNQGAVRLIIEGDRNRDGTFEAMIGDEVPPGTPLRVRTEGARDDRQPPLGYLNVRVNGETVGEDAPLGPGESRLLNAPDGPGWVRARLYLQEGVSPVDPGCAPPQDPPISLCSNDLSVAALTSPIWVGEKVAKPPVDDSPKTPPPAGGEADEPDRQPPLPPGGEGGQPLPDVPPQRDRPPPVTKLRATWFKAAAARHRSLRVRLRWKSSEGPFDVQVRRPGAKRWRAVATRTQKRQVIVRLPRGRWQFRARAVPPFAPEGPWRSLKIRL